MLDTSPSMFARDMDPNRLGRAQHIIQQFILHKLPDDRYALVGFNYNGVILSYLTREPQTILVYFDYLNRTTEPGVGTNMGAALISALRVIDADEQITPENRGRRRILVLISDGDDTIGQWEDPMNDVVRRQLKLYTFGLGTATGAPFPLELSPRGDVIRYAVSASGERLRSKAEATTLRELARRTSARFFRGEDERQVEAAIEEILSSGRPVAGYQSYPIRRDLVFLFLRRGIRLYAGGRIPHSLRGLTVWNGRLLTRSLTSGPGKSFTASRSRSAKSSSARTISSARC